MTGKSLVFAVLYAFLSFASCSNEDAIRNATEKPTTNPGTDPNTDPAESGDTVLVKTASQLLSFATQYNSSGEVSDDVVVLIDADLSFDSSSSSSFPGIGTRERPFLGVLEGNNHAIRNYSAFTPLVAVLGEGGIIRNLNISSDCTFLDQSGRSAVSFGPFAGVCRGTILSCTNRAPVQMKSPGADADIRLGGIAGEVAGQKARIEGCHNYSDILYSCVSDGLSHNGILLGGIVGYARDAVLTVKNCSQSGSVHSNTGSVKVNGMLCCVGGIAGYLVGGTYVIEDCSVSGTRVYPQQFNNKEALEDGVFCGGIVGVLDGSDGSAIRSCTSEIQVGGKRGFCGGIAGYAAHTSISGCVFTAGSYSGSIAHYTGGIAGDLISSSVSDCLVKADLSTTTNTAAGGIAARMDGASSISQCRYFGMIVAKAGSAGGVVGYDTVGSKLSENGFGGEINGVEMRLSNCSGTGHATESGNYLLSGSDFQGEITVSGHVLDKSGAPVAGVVVSDGIHCTATSSDGSFGLDTDLSKVKFIYVSCPSDYSVDVKDGLPQFYKSFSSLGGVYSDIEFRLEKRSDPDAPYTVFFAADPQPRASSAGYDKIGYHSLDVADDFYEDVAEKVAETPGDKFAIILGDLVHENMSLYPRYTEGIRIMGLPTWSVIGNHDNDPSATDDDSAARVYEKYLGPRCYSFNRGGIHYITVDDIIMTQPSSNGRLTEYTYGLTDDDWTFLKEDLSYVDKGTTIVICAHNPLFMKTGSDPSASHGTLHGTDYANLLSTYSRVYSFAGHTHTSFNYIYPETDIRKNIEQHTVARSTGALWINDYLCTDGTPRGYVIMEVKGPDDISWKFEPVKRQTAKPVSGSPSYIFRDWDYREDGRAVMRGSGNPLDGSYQMHVFGKGVYGNNYVYANVFLYDGKWSLPELTVGGKTVRMEPVGEGGGRYDIAFKELHDYYSANNSNWASSNPEFSYDDGTRHIFWCRVDEESFGSAASTSTSGTVTVRDRFGNTYTSEVSW